jgi:hypothetical protein
MSYASLDDVVISLGRQLTEDEETQANGLLDRIENRIRARITDLDNRIDVETYLSALVEAESDAVARVLRNPGGLLQEQDGDYAYTRFRSAGDIPGGKLALSSDEWSRLGVSSGAFTITPSLGTTEGTWPAVDDNYHDSLVWISLP